MTDKRTRFFPAVEDEEPALTDSLGRVIGHVYQQEAGQTVQGAIHAARNMAAECGCPVFVYSASERFVGTAV